MTNQNKQLKMVITMMRAIGVLLIALGLYGFTENNLIAQNLFENDLEITKIVSAIFVFVGCIDLFLIPKILPQIIKPNEKK